MLKKSVDCFLFLQYMTADDTQGSEIFLLNFLEAYLVIFIENPICSDLKRCFFSYTCLATTRLSQPIIIPVFREVYNKVSRLAVGHGGMIKNSVANPFLSHTNSVDCQRIHHIPSTYMGMRMWGVVSLDTFLPPAFFRYDFKGSLCRNVYRRGLQIQSNLVYWKLGTIFWCGSWLILISEIKGNLKSDFVSSCYKEVTTTR